MTIELTNSKRLTLELNALYSGFMANKKLHMVYGEDIYSQSAQNYLQAFENIFSQVRSADLLDDNDAATLGDFMEDALQELVDQFEAGLKKQAADKVKAQLQEWEAKK